MKILAIESTASVCSVSISEDEKLIAELNINTQNKHSENLLPSIEQIIRFSGINISEIDLYSYSAGPGSFTGVRIGSATIKGLAFGKNKPCAAVSSLYALAQGLQDFDGILCPVILARKTQVYNALFECSCNKIKRICDDRVIDVSVLEEELLNIKDKAIYLTGDGYSLCKERFSKININSVPPKLRIQSAYNVALSALDIYKLGRASDDKKIFPSYLRLSQAEREREEKLKGNVI